MILNDTKMYVWHLTRILNERTKMINSVKTVNTKDYPHDIVLVNSTPITGHVDDIVSVCEKLNALVNTEYNRDLRQEEWETIFAIVLKRRKI